MVPLFQFVEKEKKCMPGRQFTLSLRRRPARISDGVLNLNFWTDGRLWSRQRQYIDDLYFEYDARDGRPAVGCLSQPSHPVPGSASFFGMRRDNLSAGEIGRTRCEEMMAQEVSGGRNWKRIPVSVMRRHG